MEKEHITAQIKIKARPSDKKRWEAAVKKEGRTVSDVCRAALERLTSRVEKKDAAQ